MLDLEEGPPAGPEDPRDLGDRPARPRDEGEGAPARDHEVERPVAARERLDVGLRQPGSAAARHRRAQEPGGEIHAERVVAELRQDRRLESGAAAGVQGPQAPAAGPGRELPAHEAVEDRVEVLVPGLELVVRCRHRVEGRCGIGCHGASVAKARVPGERSLDASSAQDRAIEHAGATPAAGRSGGWPARRGERRPAQRLRPAGERATPRAAGARADPSRRGRRHRLGEPAPRPHARIGVPGPAARRGLRRLEAHDRRGRADRDRPRRARWRARGSGP